MLPTQTRILYRAARADGQQLPPTQNIPDSSMAHILVSLPKRLVQMIVSSPKGKETLQTIFRQCESICLGHPAGNANASSSDLLVDTFINAINSEDNFPLIVIDDNVKSTFGCIWLTEGVTSDDAFHIGKFELSIDSKRVHEMVQAHGFPNKESLELYQFQLACTLLRFVGQIFGFYLKCHMRTSPPLEALLKLKTEEAGVLLESEIFGGNIDWFRDQTGGDGQPGQPFRPDIDDSGRIMSWTRVNHQYIRDLVNQNLSFPAVVATGEVIGFGDRLPLYPPE